MSLLLASTQINDLWYSVPVIVSVSLVYAATRSEEMSSILSHATRFGIWVLGFMVAAFAVLYWLSSKL